jgi:hypothetical protein
MARFGEVEAQYFDDAGDPLSSGTITFYESGTTTLKTTYSDINQTIPNTNPVVLTAAGRQPAIFFSGTAKAVLATSGGTQIVSADPVGETSANFGDAWVATKIYDANAVVIGSDGVYYRSLAAGNQNNNPTSTSGYWTLLYSIEWSTGITYQEGATATYNNILYQSIQNNNLNNVPNTATAYWTRVGIAWVSTNTYAINENVVGSDGVFYTSLQNSNLNNEPSASPSYWVGTSAAAAASATAAATSATNAATSETNAGNSATAAATSETNAATSATNAGNSATAAATSETNAATSETNASNSASAAATSATNAATSETNAGNSATAAASSATAASTSESNAAASATTASTAATNAGTSETNAATSATNASNSATAAATSATNAATSESNAATSATAAATSATASATSATASAGSATNAASSLADFNTKYLGAHATAPTGTAAGQQYFNTTSDTMFVYTGSSWTEAGSAVNGTSNRVVVTATAAQTDFSISYDVGYVDVYLNGSKLQAGTDFTATNGVTVVLTSGAASGDIVDMVAYGAFNVANVYTQTESDARFAQLSNNLSDLPSASTALTNLGLTASAAEINKLDGMTSSKTELNVLTGIPATLTPTEVGYLDGVTSNIQTQINNVGGGNEASFVASGAISSKAPVILKSDGKAEAISQTTISTAFGTLSNVNAYQGGDYPSMCYHEAEDCVVLGFSDSANNYYGTIVCGTIDSATKTITWDWANRLVHYSAVGQSAYYHSLVYSQRSGNNRVGVFFRGNSLRGHCQVISVSGTTPSTTGAIQQFSNNYQTGGISATIDSTTSSSSTVIVSYTEAQSGGKQFLRGFEVGSSSMSYGSEFDMTSNLYSTGWLQLVYHASTSQFCLFGRDDNASYYGKMATITNSGTTISSVNNVVTYSSSSTYNVEAAYSTNDDKFLVGYTDVGDSYKGKCFSVSLSGTTLSLGGASATIFYNDNIGSITLGICYNPVAKKFAMVYHDVGIGDDQDIKTATLSSSDYTVTLSAATELSNNGGYYSKLVYDPDTELIATLYQDADNLYFYTTAIQVGYDSTNLTTTNFLGIADAAISDTATGTVILEGAVISGLSSLTIGSTYYVLPTGVLSTSAGTPSVTLGMAISATAINMRGAT